LPAYSKDWENGIGGLRRDEKMWHYGQEEEGECDKQMLMVA
jgi:hypothetical protein